MMPFLILHKLFNKQVTELLNYYLIFEISLKKPKHQGKSREKLSRILLALSTQSVKDKKSQFTNANWEEDI